jgi:hypothetical protein
LWIGNHIKEKMASSIWERLSMSNKEGGWGLKNKFYVSKALVVKRLWKVIIGTGMWRHILIQKYILSMIVLD